MQSPLILMQNLLIDASNKCSTHMSYQRDFETISRRYEHEGMSFLTITLPTFLDDFMLSIENGEISPTCFVGWKKRGCLPAFLQGFTRLVFNSKGRLENESVKAIHLVRQICSFFKKVKLPCTKEREFSAFQSYIDIDNEIQESFEKISDSNLDTFITISRIFISTLFPIEPDLDELIPHHGPGSTQERIIGNKKYLPQNFPWIKRLSRFFSIGNVMFSSEECYRDSGVKVEILELHQEPPVRVISVPKTLKTPRIIAMEPVSMQMCQQAIKDFVVQTIEENELTSGHINFSDQRINQDLALNASKTGLFGTLDLSAASDRVHKDLVYLMLTVNPVLRDLVFTTRSRSACVDDKIILLNKFASMGSALCFPIEALYFTILCVQGILSDRNLPITLRNIKTVMKSVYVYGDDIIVPTKHVEAVVNTLTVFGNVVGLKKSFYRGGFRESCGLDAYRGEKITPIYLRQIPPTARGQAQKIVSCIDTTNQLFKAGFVETANHLVKVITRVTGNLPVVQETSAGLGWHFDVETVQKTRFNRQYQRSEVKTLVCQIRQSPDLLDGYGALCKCLYKLHRKPVESGNKQWMKTRKDFDQRMFSDDKHLLTTPRRGSLTLKSRWIAA